ncbi:gamma-glutamylcyclotransferase family protein [Kribbella sindirgiensis]|uniref:Gamma-glutamylcyclotransferase n=1 Tax=Kribbella sindirgiensis TaxID=1124744 RepID=A0A4R0ITX9_9ACTN|nr:gamma-glutamylcyclotransferase family protein [Kribbella sindirgiensis]TCC34888.1 gamma-glutamylcyclotransferase [Kribbella sindirgiensis]
MPDDAADRRSDVFFYGLYMDPEVLVGQGVEPCRPRPAAVNDHVLRIGKQATLVPCHHEQAFGMVYSLTQSEVNSLYGRPGLEGYRAEPMLARLIEGGVVPALSYILSKSPPEDEEANCEYARALRAVMIRLGLPTPPEAPPCTTS